ncbi:EAL domain-containing protein [Ruminococcus sp. HUN007]|uniref:EAL domain-containing protein n=1 Tax=Ruminococcus sp. HUN007 TaxID=1514668 RepID=UPI0005D1DC39|nr:EAL domain-containing protein [Ruminococcus sp. HUN007]
MRSVFSFIFTVVIIAQLVCVYRARHSGKPIGRYVAALNSAIIPPLLGNLIIIGSHQKILSLIGSYIYFLGVDLVVLTLTRFTVEYCKTRNNSMSTPRLVYIPLAVDVIQFMLNPFTGHAFDLKAVDYEGAVYWKLEPYIGQTYHRLVAYSIVVGVVVIFLKTASGMPKIYRERYTALSYVVIFVGLWQGLYLMSDSPIDRSMLGYGALGILIYFFSLHYRPYRLLDRMLSRIVSGMNESLFIFDPAGKCIWANDAGLELTGVDEDNVEKAVPALMELFRNPGSENDTGCVQRIVGNGDDAHYYTLEENKALDEKRKSLGTYLRISDVTEEQNRMKREMYAATHDPMTGLYTREYLFTCISERLENDTDTEYLIMYVDVKNFNVVNDIFGVEFGDQAMKHIASWIQNNLSRRCIYGRLIGAAFGVCMPREEWKPEYIEEILTNFMIHNYKAEYHILINVGVCEAEHGENNISLLFDRALLALTVTSDDIRGHIAFYDAAIREKLLMEQKLSSQLGEAIENMQVCPYLQPIADENGKIVGAEALARWEHPELGFLPPCSFIPAFERNGLIAEVDQHMWRSACSILSRWKKAGSDLFISVNISPKDFYYIDVYEKITSFVNEFGIEPEKLRIEITESFMINDAEKRMAMLEKFRESGFIVEMDDFGSGYSSLNMLKDMPVDVLKIDMKFLDRDKTSEKAKIIVHNVISLTKDLGIVALTEGVETRAQFSTLSDMGCMLFQGYYFSKPMPVKEFEKFAGIAD